MARNIFLTLAILCAATSSTQAQGRATYQPEVKQISYSLTQNTEFAAASTGEDTEWITIAEETPVAVLPVSERVVSSVGCDCGVCDSCTSGCGSCYSGSCGSCGSCVDQRRYLRRTWASFDYLYWDVPGYFTPALVTTAPQGQAVTLPTATVAFGSGLVEDGYRSGGRIRTGVWFDDCTIAGIQFEFFGMMGEDTHFALASNSDPGIGIPFFNSEAAVNAEDAILVANFAGNVVTLTGAIAVDTSSNIYSTGVLLRHLLSNSCGTRIDFLGGYRYFKVDEGLTLRSSTVSQSLTSGLAVGTTIDINNVFDTDNDFHGGELGVNIAQSRGCWSLDVLAKVALGSNRQTVRIDGQTVITVPGVNPVTTNQGVFAQSSVAGYTGNIGEFDRSVFTAIPELGATLGYRVRSNVRATLGYSAIYVSDVVRPGNQIDRNVNGTLFTNTFAGTQRPQLRFDSRDLWMFGVTAGLEVTF